MIMTISSTFRNAKNRAVYLISYIQRGNGTDTAFHRTYSCFETKTYKITNRAERVLCSSICVDGASYLCKMPIPPPDSVGKGISQVDSA